MYSPLPVPRVRNEKAPIGRLERVASVLPLRTSFVVIVVALGVVLGGIFLRSQYRTDLSDADAQRLAVLGKQVRAVREHLEHAGDGARGGELRSEFGSPVEEPSLGVAVLVSSEDLILDALRPERIGLPPRLPASSGWPTRQTACMTAPWRAIVWSRSEGKAKRRRTTASAATSQPRSH